MTLKQVKYGRQQTERKVRKMKRFYILLFTAVITVVGIMVYIDFQRTTPAPVWAPYEPGENTSCLEAVVIEVPSKEVSIDHPLEKIPVTVKNNSQYQIRFVFGAFSLQKWENGQWMRVRSFEPVPVTPSSGEEQPKGVAAILLPGQWETDAVALLDMVPLSLLTQGRYRIYLPFSYGEVSTQETAWKNAGIGYAVSEIYVR